MKTVRMTKLKCKRCEYSWYPRGPYLPKVCPSCKSRGWQTKKEVKKEVPVVKAIS